MGNTDKTVIISLCQIGLSVTRHFPVMRHISTFSKEKKKKGAIFYNLRYMYVVHLMIISDGGESDVNGDGEHLHT